MKWRRHTSTTSPGCVVGNIVQRGAGQGDPMGAAIPGPAVTEQS